MLFQASILINLILNQYFNNTGCLLILSHHRLDYFNYHGKLPTIYVNLQDPKIPENLIFRYYGFHGIIIIGQNPINIFENLELKMKSARDRFNFRRYLLISTDDHFSTDLKNFQSKAMRFVEDILIICSNSSRNFNTFEEDEHIFELYTHKFVGPEEHLTDTIWFDRWYYGNRSFLTNSNLYPNKIYDQQGRILRVVCFTYKPFTIVDPPDGTDMLVVLEYAKKHNMTTELVVDENGSWGEFYDNGTGSGIVGNMGKDKGDVGVAAVNQADHYRFFDFSTPITRCGVTCIAPAPRLVTGLMIPLIPFSREMWVMVALSYLAVSAIMYTLLSMSIKKRNRKRHSRIFKVFMAFRFSARLFSLQSLRKELKRPRLLLALALILCWLLNTIYNSGFSSIMTVPRYQGVIHDVNDLAMSGIKWSAASPAWTVTLRSDDREVYKKVISNFMLANEEKLAKFNDKYLAYAIERLQGGNLAIKDYVTLKGAQERRLLDEDLYWEHKIVLLRKNSILQPSLNKLIFSITESGLVHFWEYKTVVKYMDLNIQKAIKESTWKYSTSDSKIKLGLKHIVGAITIWCIGVVFSIIAFIFELAK